MWEAAHTAAMREWNITDDAPDTTVGLMPILKTLLRWSWVVALLGLLTVWLTLNRTESIQPEYTAEAALLLVGPSERLIENGFDGEITIDEVNPLEQLGGTLPTVATVTMFAISDPGVSMRLESEGLTSDYEVGTESRTPILRIEATDETPQIARRTVERLTELVSIDLDRRQNLLNAPETDRITAQVISSGVTAGPDFSDRSRVRMALALVGFTLSVGAAFLLEGISQIWQRRRRTNPPATSLASRDVENADQLVKVLHFVGGDRQHAESLAAKTRTRAARQQGQTTDDLSDWCYREALNELMAEPPASPDGEDTPGPLWHEVLALAPEQRAILALSDIADMPPARVARILELDAGEVAGRALQASEAVTNAEDNAEPVGNASRAPNGDGDIAADTTKKKGRTNTSNQRGKGRPSDKSKSSQSAIKAHGRNGRTPKVAQPKTKARTHSGSPKNDRQRSVKSNRR